MTTTGVVVNRTNMVEDFSGMRNSINGSIVWHAGNHPFNPGATNDYGSNLPAQGSSAGEATGDLGSQMLSGDSLITASTIINNFRNYSVLLSRIRRCRLIRYYNDNGTNVVTYDDNQITSTGQSTWQRGFGDVGASFGSGTDVTASGVDSFVSSLNSVLAGHRDSTLIFSEYYCHSSCHSSCHGSGL